MKKAIAITATLVVLMSCSKDAGINDSSFVKGQQVTLKVNAGVLSTKVSSELSTSTGEVSFKWEAKDKILVSVGTESAEFTLAGGAGTSSATFTGKMPAGGDKFSMQYPVTDPTLSVQSFSSAEAIPHDKMKLTATDCSVSASEFTLTPQYSALRLNLYGTDRTISKIVVTNTTSSAEPKPSYTLNIDGGLTLPTTDTDAKAFFIVVPAGDWNFSAEVFDNSAYQASICTFSKTSTDKYFTAAQILNIPAVEVKKNVLLPGKFSVAEGKQVQFTAGNLYYSTTDSKYHIEPQQNVTYATLGQSTYDAAHVCLFYWANITDWQTSGMEPWAETYSFSARSTEDKFFCGIDNPMTVDGQDGLYALAGGPDGEWYYLIEYRTNASSLCKHLVSVTTEAGTVTNCLVLAPDNWDYTNYPLQAEYSATSTPLTWAAAESAGLVCLPAAGAYSFHNFYSSGDYGMYWSATSDGKWMPEQYYVRSLYFHNNSSPAFNSYRNDGQSIRLVSTAR